MTHYTSLSLSVATAISGNQIVGYGATTGGNFALLWNPNPATAINLNPTGYSGSQAFGTSGTQQVGYAIASTGYSHAMAWLGTAASAIDLHPSTFQQSFAEGVASNTVVGYAVPSIGTSSAQAYIWSLAFGTSANLNPSGFLNSFALGISDGVEVGYGTNSSGKQVALLWTGNAASAVNLSAFLPTGATNAEATGIDIYGNIIGSATINGQVHAFLWQRAVPPAFTNIAQAATTSANLSYSFTFTAAGTPAPIFTITPASLPTGLNLSSAGVLSGTPTQTGTFTATVTASNGFAPAATQRFTLTVVPKPASQMITVGTLSWPDGIDFLSNLIQASDGNFYGAAAGGIYGSIFEITPGGTESVYVRNGNEPQGLLQGPDGSFYGTTMEGGSSSPADGSVFKITQGVLTTLHSFQDPTVAADGRFPRAPLTLGTDGTYYGVAAEGGTTLNNGNNGLIFKITSQGTYTILHTFMDGSVTNDGSYPIGALIQASDGNFYGTTYSGGSSGSYGCVYQMTPSGAITILHGFNNGIVTNDGQNPSGPLVQARDGNFYGTTAKGGTTGKGTIFKMTPQGTVTILHSFGDGTVGNDGVSNVGLTCYSLVEGLDGNLYGVTEFGGSAGEGTLFQITLQGAMLVLHSFGDGSVSNESNEPTSGLLLASDGNFYGIAGAGAAETNGSFFKFSIQSGPVFTNNPTLAAGTAGDAYSFSFTVFGSPAPTFTSGTLPPGLTLSANGVLSGTPTQSGTYTVIVTATNGSGTVTQSFTIAIGDALPATDTPTMPPGGLALLALLLMAIAARSPPPVFNPDENLLILKNATRRKA